MDGMTEEDFGDALLGVIGSGHAVLRQLDAKSAVEVPSHDRQLLIEAASRLIDLASKLEAKSKHMPASDESERTLEPTRLTQTGITHGGEASDISLSRPGRPNVATTQEPVIIIGAGIGGLCLAQGLKRAGRDFRVFERDAALHDRPQGYRLKIEENGAEALRTTLTSACFEAFTAACAVTTTGQTDYNPVNGNITNSRAGSGLAGRQGLSATYTVDREVFRTILMTGIADCITFGKQLESYDLTSDGDAVLATFRDGSRVHGSFLVGADGVRSSVRKQMLPELKYVDTGAVCIYGKTPITPALEAEFPAKALRWMTAYVDRAPSIQAILIGDSPLTLLSEPIRFSEQSRALMRLPEDYVYWAMIGRKELFTDTTPVETYSASQAAKFSLELTKEWDDSMSALLRLQDFTQCSAMPVVSAMPELPTWQPSDRVTLLGDAIHAMSPCGGVGANTALVDAAELAKLFGGPSCGYDLTPESIGNYEASMRKRAFGMIMRSFVGSKKMFDQRPFGECPTVKW